jgi:hypothetical protein
MRRDSTARRAKARGLLGASIVVALGGCSTVLVRDGDQTVIPSDAGNLESTLSDGGAGATGDGAAGLDASWRDSSRDSSRDSARDSARDVATSCDPTPSSPLDGEAPCTMTCGDGGRCLLTLAALQFGPSGLAVGSSAVYWTNTARSLACLGTVMSAPLECGPLQTIAAGRNGPVNDWLEYGSLGPMTFDGGLYSISLDASDAGSTVTQLASLAWGEAGIMAADATSVYWSNDETLLKMPLGGGEVTTLAVVSEYLTALVVGGNDLYWVSDASDEVLRVSTDGGTPSTVASGQDYPSAIVASATSIAWANPLGGGSIMTCPLGDCPTPTLLASASDARFPIAVAMDADNAYWIESCAFLSASCGELYIGGSYATDSLIMRAPLAGGAPETLATVPGQVNGSIAVDDTSVYFTDGNSFGKVVKVTPK